MSKYAIRMTHGEYLEAGEVTKDTPKCYFISSIEGCPHSHVSGKFAKDDIVFECDDKGKVIRLMTLYVIACRQHTAVISAANKAFKEVLEIITQQKGQVS